MTETIVNSTEAVSQAVEQGGNHIVNALLSSAAGMIGIFAVVGVIIFVVTVLNKVGNGKNK